MFVVVCCCLLLFVAVCCWLFVGCLFVVCCLFFVFFLIVCCCLLFVVVCCLLLVVCGCWLLVLCPEFACNLQGVVDTWILFNSVHVYVYLEFSTIRCIYARHAWIHRNFRYILHYLTLHRPKNLGPQEKRRKTHLTRCHGVYCISPDFLVDFGVFFRWL